MTQLHMGYDEIMNSPWEVVEWLYNRHVQELIELEKQKEQQRNHFI